VRSTRQGGGGDTEQLKRDMRKLEPKEALSISRYDLFWLLLLTSRSHRVLRRNDLWRLCLRSRIDVTSASRRGWKKVQLDDTFFLGLEEPGFQELEEIAGADARLIDGDIRAVIAKADAELKDTGYFLLKKIWA
jgi:hypothetical protein